MSITVAMYSHDSVGLGHLRRNRAIAFALAEHLPPGSSGILIAGHPAATRFSLPAGWDWLVLPGYARTPDGYTARALHMGVSGLSELRSLTITAALAALSPDLFIVDRHPFGVDDELRPVLDMLHTTGCVTVLGLREVLDTPAVAHAEWRTAETAAAYGALWVYGDPAIHDPVASGEIPAELAPLVSFTGYLSRGRHVDEGDPVEAPYLLTTVGGGSDGGQLARIAARTRPPEGHRHLVVTGPQMSEAELLAVRALAATHHTQVTRFVPNLPTLIRDAAGVVCMGGYNSLAEVMATDTPALVIPRNTRRAEQPIRARALADAAVSDTIDIEELTPRRLGDWMVGAATRRVSRDHVDLDGLQRVGHLATALLAEVSSHV